MMIKQVETKPTGVSFGVQKFDKEKHKHKGVEPKTTKPVNNYDVIRAKVADEMHKKVEPKSAPRGQINIGL